MNRCGSCGVAVPSGAERCPACGARVDVTLIELGREPTPRRRRLRVERAGDRRFDRRWLLVAIAAVVAWAGVAFVIGGDDGGTEETRPVPTSRPRRTTTTTAVPGAPLLGEKTGLVVLLSGTLTRALDLDTGEAERLSFGSLDLVRADGVVARGAQGEMWWRPHPFDDATAVRLGPGGGGVMDATGTDAVWVLDDRGTPSSTWRLVGLDGVIRGEVTVPSGVWPMWAGVGGIVVGVGGRVHLLRVDGTTGDLGVGEVFGGSQRWVFVRRCDDPASCRLERVDALTGESVALETPMAGAWRAYGFTADASGRLAGVVEVSPFEEDLSLVAYVVRPDGTIEHGQSLPPAYDPLFVWSPDGRWLLASSGSGTMLVLDTYDYSMHEVRIGSDDYLAGVLQSQG